MKSIPELRFSTFNNEWQEKKLGDLGKTYTGLSGKTKNDFGFGDSHFITYMNVFKNNIAKFEMIEKVKISSNEKQNKVNYGDIFFTTSSEVPQEVGMTSIWLFKTNNVYLNSFCFGFRITINNVLPIFLARYLRSENIRKKITVLAQGSTRFNLSKKEVMKLPINFPEINEQQKIGDFFEKLDHQIELEEKKLELLEQQKRGCIQKIFSQELRFKDENGNEYPNWVTKKLDNILSERNYKQIPEKDIPLMAFTSTGGIEDKGERYNREFLVKNKNKKYKRTELNDLIYSSNNLDVGAIGLNRYGTSVISDVYEIFIIKEKISPQYIEIAITQPKFMNKILKYRQGALYGQFKIYPRDFLNIDIELPSIKEQDKIGSFINEIDILINKQNIKLELLKQRKQGFLQKMFV